jgi:hypothetical protein
MTESEEADGKYTELKEKLAALIESEDCSRNSIAKASKVRIYVEHEK